MNGNAQQETVDMATEKQKFEIASALVKAAPMICEGMSKKTAQIWVGDQKLLSEIVTEAVRKALMPMVVIQPKPKLLEFIGTVSVPATTKKFVAKKKFVINISDDAAVKVSCLGDNFKEEFLDKTEKPFAGSELRQQKLREASVDGPIIAELGGEAKAETTLAEVFVLMKKQGKGESGALLNNGWWNIFYVRNAKSVLRAVNVHWDGGGWYVLANSVEDSFRWNDSCQVFSRNS